MPGRIPQNFIDDVLDRLDIIDVIGSRIELRKSGKNYSACCPFHDEKTPSFSVSPDKQFYYCFGCGVGGNAVGFVLDFDKTTFPETIENLAKRVGLEMPAEAISGDSERNYKKLLFPVIKDADSFYRRNLRDPTNAKKAIDYLKSRGLNGETARNFGIGFASPG
jgi:DNA primase